MKPLLTPSRGMPALDRWHRLAAEMLHPCFELDVESFALLLSTFRAAQREGTKFDGGMVALMELLDRQARDTDDDTDADIGVDDGEEYDDPDDEGQEEPESDGCDDEGIQPEWHSTFAVKNGKAIFARKGAA